MQSAARAVAIVRLHPKRVVFGGEIVQQRLEIGLEVGKGTDAEPTQHAFAHLPFNAPNAFLLAPKLIKPNLAALLGDLGDLVVDPQHHVASAKGESLDLSVLAVLGILAGECYEIVFVEIHSRQVIVETKIYPAHALRSVRLIAQTCCPIEKGSVQPLHRITPNGFASESHKKWRIIVRSEFDSVVGIAQYKRITGTAAVRGEQKLPVA